MTKNEKIRQTRLATKERRKHQFCRVFSVKIQKNRLTARQKEDLKMIFVEGKWLYNDILNWMNERKENSPFDYVVGKTARVKNKDGVFEIRELTHIGSQIKQSIRKQMCTNLKTLAGLKRNGHKVGRLKFISNMNFVDLEQYKKTYSIYEHKIKIQGVHGRLYVNGLKQIPKECEIANAKLVRVCDDYFVRITTFTDNKYKEKRNNTEDVGIDFGCQTSFTLSTGEKIDVKIEEPVHLKRLQQKMARQKKGTNNRHKTIGLIQKQYKKISNIKDDKANKMVSYLNKNFRYICIQDDNIHGWDKGHFGKTVHHSILGRVKKKLKSQDNVWVVPRFEPTSKMCLKCGNKNTNLTLSDRTFVCPVCGHVDDRDVHAAKNILQFGLKQVSVERTDVKPVETETPVISNGSKSLSMNQEDFISLG